MGQRLRGGKGSRDEEKIKGGGRVKGVGKMCKEKAMGKRGKRKVQGKG